jgi:RHS repeat-associated protein
VVLPSGDSVQNLIDAQNRRVGRLLNGVVTHRWLYQNQLNPVAELDGAGAVVSRFVYGTRLNVPDYVVRGSSVYRYVTDHLGSVRVVVDTATGAVAQRLDYDEWGSVTLNTAPGWQPFGFAGGLQDDATGLVRFGARDYDPAVGRWTAKDPIGFEGGSSGLMTYVAGDPVNVVDRNGYEGLDADEVRDAADVAASLVPGLSTGLDAIVAATGFNPITGRCVGGLDRVFAFVGLIAPAVSGGELRLAGKAFHKHHIFPQAREFRQIFRNAGINVDHFTVRIEADFHLRVLHGGSNGGPWNREWREFFAKNVGVGHEEIIQFGQDLANRWGIGDLPWGRYR